jgi:hypothetical protein
MDRAIKASLFCQPLMMLFRQPNHRNEDDCGTRNKKYIALIATAERT